MSITAIYDYRDEAGVLLYQTVRIEPGPDGASKTFRQRRPLGQSWAYSLEFGDYRKDGNGVWRLIKPGEPPAGDGDLKMQRRVPTVLYRLPELLAAPSTPSSGSSRGKKMWRRSRLGLTATCNPTGAGKWRTQYNEALRGRRCVILPDNDEAGQKHALQVEGMLLPIAASVWQLDLPGLPPGDVTDWFELGHTPAELLALVEEHDRNDQARNSTRQAFIRLASIGPSRSGALPEPLRSFAERGLALDCDPALVILPCLSTAASCIGNTRTLMLRRDWRGPCVFWTAIVSESGTRKSPANLLPVKHLFDVQHRLLRDYQVEKEAWEEAQQERRRQRRGGIPATSTPGEKPQYRQMVCSDVTVECLATILQDNPRGVLLWRDELSGWFGSFNRYREAGTDLPQWLEFFRAGTLVIDRKTGDRPRLLVPMAAVSVCGTITPRSLSSALTPDFLEAGLGARILLASPPRRRKIWTDAEIDPDTERAWAAMLDASWTLISSVKKTGRCDPSRYGLLPRRKRNGSNSTIAGPTSRWHLPGTGRRRWPSWKATPPGSPCCTMWCPAAGNTPIASR